ALARRARATGAAREPCAGGARAGGDQRGHAAPRARGVARGGARGDHGAARPRGDVGGPPLSADTESGLVTLLPTLCRCRSPLPEKHAMFLALRELRFARGRFTLMGIVIALIAVLVVLLSGLSSGLVNDGVSGLKSMTATSFAFDKGTITDNAFSRSLVDDEQLATWQAADEVDEAEPMGVSIVNGTTESGTQVDLTLFGITPGSLDRKSVVQGKSDALVAGGTGE